MSLRRLVALLIVTSALLVLAASTSSAARLESCGGGVRAVKVGCAKAKRVAKEFSKTHRRAIWGYTCSAGNSMGRCVLDRKIIVFALD